MYIYIYIYIYIDVYVNNNTFVYANICMFLCTFRTCSDHIMWVLNIGRIVSDSIEAIHF